MTTLALLLVLLSAMAHATWNFLTKRANNQEVFIWWLLIVISVLLSPLAVVLLIRNPVVYPGWWFVLGTIILHALYFVFLGRSYSRADLSLVYPIARGVGPALVPVLGFLVLSETITPPAITGIITVITGIYFVYWWGRLRQVVRDPLRLFREAGARYALLTGLVNATQSIWDKVGVSYVDPFLYMYLLALGGAIVLSPYMFRVHGMKTVRAEWQKNTRYIVISGMLMFLAYSLVLTAMQFSRVSYIIPIREVGIVFGVILGTLMLRESFNKGRILGSCLIVLGVVFISIAP
jgi:uncharacterized membrane protein